MMMMAQVSLRQWEAVDDGVLSAPTTSTARGRASQAGSSLPSTLSTTRETLSASMRSSARRLSESRSCSRTSALNRSTAGKCCVILSNQFWIIFFSLKLTTISSQYNNYIASLVLAVSSQGQVTFSHARGLHQAYTFSCRPSLLAGRLLDASCIMNTFILFANSPLSCLCPRGHDIFSDFRFQDHSYWMADVKKIFVDLWRTRIFWCHLLSYDVNPEPLHFFLLIAENLVDAA